MSRTVLPISALMVLLAATSANAQDLNGQVSAETSAAATPASSAEPAEAQSESEKADAKDKPAPNSVFLEGLGAGLYYSLNYERRVIDDLGLRAGLGYLAISAHASSGSTSASAKSSFVTIPLTVSYLGVRSGRSGLELGGGMTLAFASGSVSAGVSSSSGSGAGVLGTALVGYRLHPVDGAGFQFRVGVMALAAKGLGFNPAADKFGVLPWLYLSLGVGF